jgi:hypothetical protein
MVAGDGSSLIKPRVAPIAEALDAARFGAPHLVGNAAQILADRWPANAPRPLKVDPLPAPDIAWVAWLGAAVDPETAPARPGYLRAPTPSRQGSVAQRPSHHHDGMVLPIGGAAARPWSNRPARARAARLAQLHGASFHRGWAKANSR